MALDFQKIFDSLKDEVISLASLTFKKHKEEAKADASKLIQDLKEDLKTWTLQLADGQISKSDFEFLIMGQKELIEMNALKQVGLAIIELDKFKTSILNLIINTVLGLI